MTDGLRSIRFADRCRPDRRAQIVDDLVEPLPPSLSSRVTCLQRLDLASTPHGVSTSELIELTGRVEPLDGELADGLEHAIPGRGPGIDEQQAVVGEARQAVTDLCARPTGGGNGDGGVDVEPAGEHGDGAERRLCALVEQAVAPVDCVAE